MALLNPAEAAPREVRTEPAAAASRPPLARLIGPLLVAVLFAEVVLFGGDRREVALVFALLQCAGLAAVLSFSPSARATLDAIPELRPAYALFAALLLWIAVQLAPLPTGMARTAWAAVGGLPAITLDRYATVAEALKLIGLGAVFVMGVIIGADRRSGGWAFKAFLVLGTAYCLWAIAAYAFESGREAVSSGGRQAATLVSPNTAAALFALVAVAGWTSTLRHLRLAARSAASDVRFRRWTAVLVPGGCTALAIWGIAQTGSRGGVIAAGVALLTTVLVARRPNAETGGSGRALLAGAVLLTGFLLMTLSLGPFADRMSLVPDDMANRVLPMEVYLDRLDLLPLTGFGLGTFRRFNSLVSGSSDAAALWGFGAMHNVYLQWLYEAGPLGALLMFACIGWCLILCMRWLKHHRRWTVFALGASALLLVHGAIAFDLQIPALAAIWSLALGAGIGSGAEAAASSHSRRKARAPAGSVILD